MFSDGGKMKIIKFITLAIIAFYTGAALAQNTTSQIDDKRAFETILTGTPNDVKKLVQNGYNVNKVYLCNTPLTTAVKSAIYGLQQQATPSAALEKIKILIAAGADVNKVPCSEKGMSALNWAVILPGYFENMGNMSVAVFNNMIQAGVGQCNLPSIISKPCKDITDSEKESINKTVHASFVEMGKQWMPYFMEIIDYLVSNGANVNGNTLNRKQIMPIHLAATNPQEITLEPLKYLIQKGANINIQDSDGNTPLFWAYGSQNHNAVEILQKAGADISIKNKNGTLYNQVISKTILGVLTNLNVELNH